MIRILLAILVLLTFATARAGELEFYAGANSTTYDDVPDADTWGISLRAQYNFAQNESGWIINLNAPGISLLASTLTAGYLWRTHGNDFYWEGGLSAGYGAVFGPEANLIAGFGYHVAANFFFDFPVTAGTSGLTWAPYLGFTF